MAMGCSLDEVRACADCARQAAEWAIAIQVTVRTTVWSGDYMGEGTPSNTNTVISPKCPVRQLSAHEVAASGGLYELEDLKIGPITPEYVASGGGGYTPEELAPEGGEKTEVVYLLTGDIDGTYVRVRLDTTDPTGYYLVIRNSFRSPRRVP